MNHSFQFYTKHYFRFTFLLCDLNNFSDCIQFDLNKFENFSNEKAPAAPSTATVMVAVALNWFAALVRMVRRAAAVMV